MVLFLSFKKTTCHGDETPNNPAAGSCAGGTITFPDDTRGQVSTTGGFMLDFSVGNGGVVGFRENSLSIADVSNRTYSGLLFEYEPGNDTISPVKATFSGTTGTGTMYSNVETGATDPAQTTSFVLSTMTNGLLKGTLGGNNFAAATYRVNGATVMFIISKDSGTAPNNALLVSK